MIDRFRELTGGTAAGVWSAPGRVNLIGEHTDYNEGWVLPFAIDRRTRVAVRLRDDRAIRGWSSADEPPFEHHLHDALAVGGWGAYVTGVAWTLDQHGVDVPGFDIVVDSDVPVGAGLSSSAALTCAIAVTLDDLLDARAPRLDLARLCQQAEREVVGAPVGIMDQVSALCAEADHAILLDCRSLEIAPIPLDLRAAGLDLLVVDTRTRHDNASAGYASVRACCEGGARRAGVAALRDLVPEQLDGSEAGCVRHVVTENNRVLSTADVLRSDAVGEIGELLLASHRSMRDDLGVSTRALDLAVDRAVDAGALGARLTGGGFGGCAIVLVTQERIFDVRAAVRDAFADAQLPGPDIFAVSPSGPARRDT